MKQKLFTKNFIFLILGQVSSLIGNYTLKFALSMYVLEQTGSAVIFATLLAVAMIPTILLSPFGGILADRLNKRNIMVTLDILSGIAVLIVLLLFRDTFDIILIGTLLIVLSILGAFESPTVQACIPQILSGNNLLKGNAVVNQIQAVTSLIAPFAGSIVYVAVGIKPILVATIICFFLTAFLECFIQLEYYIIDKKQTIMQIIKDDFNESMQFLFKKQPGVLKLLLLSALVSFFVIGVLAVGFPFLITTILGLSAEYYGAAESIIGIAAILGGILVSILAQKLKLEKLYWLMIILGICLLPAGAAFIMPFNTFTIYIILVIMFFIGQLACSMFSIFALTSIQERTPQKLIGKVMSYVMTISLCVQPLGQFLYGVLFDTFQQSIWWVLISTGIIVLVIGCISSGFFAKLQKK